MFLTFERYKNMIDREHGLVGTHDPPHSKPPSTLKNFSPPDAGALSTPRIRKKIDIESPPITVLYRNYIFFIFSYFNTNLSSPYSTPLVTQEYAVTFYS